MINTGQFALDQDQVDSILRWEGVICRSMSHVGHIWRLSSHVVIWEGEVWRGLTIHGEGRSERSVSVSYRSSLEV